MFIVQGQRNEKRWISGIFQQHASADDYLSLIPDEARHRHSVIRIEGLSYPFYIIEDKKGFRFFSDSDARAALMNYPSLPEKDDEGDNFVNLYCIDEDWKPKNAGWDYMGSLPHEHITKDSVELIKLKGLGVFWSHAT